MSGMHVRLYPADQPYALGLLMGGEVEDKVTIVIEVIPVGEPDDDGAQDVDITLHLSNISDSAENAPRNTTVIMRVVRKYLKLAGVQQVFQSVDFEKEVLDGLSKLEVVGDEETPLPPDDEA